MTRSVPRQSTVLGPMEEGLPEIQPTDERFNQVMSYRRYRLNDVNSVLDTEVSRNLGIWIRRLRHQMERNIFDGKRPVAILNFLASFKKALDGERIPEAGALQILPHFLDGSPKDIYEGMMDDANAGCGGFSTWPHAVQFLLESYATNENIQQAVEDLEDMEMNPKETIKQFEIRITSAARELAGAYPQNALVNRFIRKLPVDARHIVRLKSPSLTGPAALKLSKITEIATAYHNSHSAIKPPVQKGVRFNTLAVEEGNTSRVANLAPPSRAAPLRRSDSVALAEGSYQAFPPSTSGYTPSIEYSCRPCDDGAPPDPYDAISMASNGQASNRSQFPSRPVQTADVRRRTNEFFPLVCFICFKSGHRSTDCQHRLRVSNDEQFIKWQCDNYSKLQEWQQMWLKSINRAPAIQSVPSVQSTEPVTDAPRPLPPSPKLMTQPKN